MQHKTCEKGESCQLLLIRFADLSHLDHTSLKCPFDHVPIRSKHTSMVDTETKIKQLLELLVFGNREFASEEIKVWVRSWIKVFGIALG